MLLSICLTIGTVFLPAWTFETSALTSEEIKAKIDTIKAQSAYKPGNKNPPENEYTRGTGCYGFVNLLSNKIFGHDIPSQKSAMELNSSSNFTKIGSTLSKSSGMLSSSSLADLFSQAKSGDIVQMDYTTYSGEDSRHTMMVYSVHSNGVVFYHAGSSNIYFGKSSGSQPLWGTTGNVLLWNDLMNCLKSSDDGISLYRSTRTQTQPHTHNYNKYIYRWDAHPHYNCYQCSCGDVKERTSEPNYVDSCYECNPPINYGDLNNDGNKSAADALIVLRYIVGKEPNLSEAALLAADVSGEDGIDAVDALLILKYVVNKVHRFPVEQ